MRSVWSPRDLVAKVADLTPIEGSRATPGWSLNWQGWSPKAGIYVSLSADLRCRKGVICTKLGTTWSQCRFCFEWKKPSQKCIAMFDYQRVEASFRVKDLDDDFLDKGAPAKTLVLYFLCHSVFKCSCPSPVQLRALNEKASLKISFINLGY